MKKTHVAILIVIAAAMGAIVSTFGDASYYGTFQDAFSNPGEELHVVGTMNKEKETKYEPVHHPNQFSFFMRDTLNEERWVILHQAKPQDIEYSEKLVVIGKGHEDGTFHASKIQLKCPSKYKDEVSSEELSAQNLP